MIDENMIEYFARTPREAVEIKEDEETKNLLVKSKLESIYVDDNFPLKKWKKPIRQMHELAEQVILETYSALKFFGNELKHRGLKIQY